MKITVSKEELPLIKNLKAFGDKHEGVITVAVHGQRFHADELIALAILKEALPEYHLQVTRTRDHSIINKVAIAIDVGGGPFDHHDDHVERYQNGVPFAACGKVLAAVEPNKALINLLLKLSFYSVQAIDNGERSTLPPECRTNYFEWVSSFNPTFEERTPTEGEYYDRFIEAFQMVLKIYRRMRANAMAMMNSTAVIRRAPMFLGGRFIELPYGGVPWHQYVQENERLLGVIHKELDGTWKVATAPKFPGSKEMRVFFPAEWGGLDGLYLETVTGIKGAVFCHRGLHLAGFETKDGALQACRILNSLYHLDNRDVAV